MKILFTCLILLAMSIPAQAHSWYSAFSDPVFGTGCCGGSDCKELDASLMTVEDDGLRVILTVEQAQKINDGASIPINALVKWARILPSQDGNWHLCIFTIDRTPPRNGVICLFQPPSM